MKVILFGATGNLGKEIARELKRQGYELTIVARNKSKAGELSSTAPNYIIADITDRKSLENICQGFDVVVSSLGKSVSLNDRSKPSFTDIDLNANSNILDEAKKRGINKFVYVSALNSENYPDLVYFKAHHDFSEKLKQSGIDYSIIKPPAIFCAFMDLVDLAKKGQLVNMGAGDKRTNPIYEGDLAEVCVNSIKEANKVIEAGGKQIYTRRQINEIIQSNVNPNKKIRSIPVGLVTIALPLLKIVSRNTYDKIAFYLAVLQHDVIAPQVGKMKLEDYIKLKAGAKAQPCG